MVAPVNMGAFEVAVLGNGKNQGSRRTNEIKNPMGEIMGYFFVLPFKSSISTSVQKGPKAVFSGSAASRVRFKVLLFTCLGSPCSLTCFNMEIKPLCVT